MRRRTRTESGFTLLELLISLAMIGVVVTACLLAVRLATASREAGFQTNDLHQRLRVLHERLNTSVRSANLIFVPADSKSLLSDENEKNSGNSKILAFEGKPDSLRFVTFGEKLMGGNNSPWMHEVRFYLQTNEETGLQEILLNERNFSPQTFFSRKVGEQEPGQTMRIAQDVAYLKFRYYYEISEKRNFEASTDEKSLKLSGEWTDKIITEPIDFKRNITDNKSTKNNKGEIILPRAVEVSVGLWKPNNPEKGLELQKAEMPPIVILVQSGMVFEQFEEEEGTSGALEK